MDYVLTFIEGFASFISPCMLPMIPIYLSYFIGENGKTSNYKSKVVNNEEKKEENNKEERVDTSSNKVLLNSIGFVIGFTIVFLLLGIFANSFGRILNENIKYIKIVFGVMIIIFGLNYMEIFKIGFLNKTKMKSIDKKNFTFIKSILFGILFSCSWTPCIGTFLSSALLLVANSNSIVKGIIMMLLYSLGLGIPFIISAIFIDKLKNVFNFIKSHYVVIKKVSGIILIVSGIYTIFF